MNLNDISMKKKEKLVENIGVMYRDSLQLAKSDAYSRVSEEEGIYHCLELRYKIEKIMQDLRLEYAFIIQKEYLEENTGKWYSKYMDEDEYEMFKIGAIDAFLHCLYG